MNYYQFVMEVKEKIEIIVGDSLHIEVASTTKNNGNKRIGLSLRDPEINIAPTIYLEEFYQSYLDSYSCALQHPHIQNSFCCTHHASWHNHKAD